MEIDANFQSLTQHTSVFISFNMTPFIKRPVYSMSTATLYALL